MPFSVVPHITAREDLQVYRGGGGSTSSLGQRSIEGTFSTLSDSFLQWMYGSAGRKGHQGRSYALLCDGGYLADALSRLTWPRGSL